MVEEAIEKGPQILTRRGVEVAVVLSFPEYLELKKQPAATWVALGVSLEATGKRSQAVEAYRRSLVAAASNQDARSYAEMRIRALR